MQPLVQRINDLEPQFQAIRQQLKEKTAELRQRHEKGESLDALLPEAFINCREALVEFLV